MRQNTRFILIVGFLSGFLFMCVSSCATAKQGYDEELLFSHEQELRKALSQIREVIKQYKIDHGHPPFALGDVIDAGYINDLPQDPFTGKKDWVAVWSDCPPPTNCKKSIQNIHSSSAGKATDGTFYKDW